MHKRVFVNEFERLVVLRGEVTDQLMPVDFPLLSASYWSGRDLIWQEKANRQ